MMSMFSCNNLSASKYDSWSNKILEACLLVISLSTACDFSFKKIDTLITDMKANNEVTSSNNYTSCDKPNVEITNRFVTESNALATTEEDGLVKQAITQADISQVDLVAISTVDGSDAGTTQDLANAIKAYINANVVPLVNAIKASQNTELTNQRTAGQQAP